MNESSAVSDIIQRMHTRRLQTDPSDALLFAPSTSGASRKRPAQPRLFDAPAPAPAPVQAQRAAAPNARAAKPVAPRSSDRSRIGLLIAAAIVAGGLGVYGASRLQIGDDAPAASMTTPALAITQPTIETTAPTPVEQAAAQPTAVDTNAQPTVAPIDTTQPTVAPPADPTAQPTVAPPVDTIAAAPTKASKHHRVVKRRKATAKRVKPSAKQTVAQPAAEVAAPKPVAKSSRRAAQSSDEESPL